MFEPRDGKAVKREHEDPIVTSMTSAEAALDGEPTEVATEAMPGMDVRRLVRLARASVADMRIDLDDAVVVTEAATGAYAVTPVIAALAGARHVYAFTRATRFGSVAAQLRTFVDSLGGISCPSA